MTPKTKSHPHSSQKKNDKPECSLFNPKKIPSDALDIIANFDSIVQNILPLNSRQMSKLPDDIRELSHQLTDERDTRRLSYMNEKTLLSAYTRYFMWWNLVRLTRLFSNIDISKTDLKDGDICLDLGSGPLTTVSALWLSRPELRKKKLTWYCLDLSQTALALGEDIYLSIAAKTISEANNDRAQNETKTQNKHDSDNSDVSQNTDGNADAPTPWKIIRVKGPLGTSIKQKARLVTCANMFNEVFQSESRPLDFLAKKYTEDLFKYSDNTTSFIIIEPGVPRSARFISLLRDSFIRKGFSIQDPCPHAERCPMDGRLFKGAHNTCNPNSAKPAHANGDDIKTGKWCNFAFPVKNAPERLQKLSASAKLAKDRAVLSFVYACPAGNTAPANSDKASADTRTLQLRIASDPIRLGDKTGFYACSSLGLTLYIPKKGQLVFSGDLIAVAFPKNELQRDKKSGALIIEG